jgi:hypothetical protein
VRDGCAPRWHRPADVTHRATGAGVPASLMGVLTVPAAQGGTTPLILARGSPAMRLELSIKSGLGEKLALLPLREP